MDVNVNMTRLLVISDQTPGVGLPVLRYLNQSLPFPALLPLV